MGRDYAPTLPELDEDRSYKAVLLTIDVEDREFDGTPERRAKLVWELTDTGETLSDFVTMRRGPEGSPATLGIGPSGASKMRQLLEAVHGSPLPTKGEWFDSNTCEFGYGRGRDEVVLGQLEPGLTVVLKGEQRTDKNGVERPKITKYRAAKPAALPVSTARLEQVAKDAGLNAESPPLPTDADRPDGWDDDES